ncbi:MAG: hypothetical protein KatS3mg129_1144 [Leptospiraceae bacterium]|nr:MAG: hypothetical protein KatS3mg129_1144 [Leptospiraceae bacterium]
MDIEIEILICYDVENNKKRKKLYDQLKQFGLIPIQKSVFWGFILPAEKNAILREVGKIIDKEDKAFLVYTNLSKVIKEQSFGYKDLEIFKNKDYIII